MHVRVPNEGYLHKTAHQIEFDQQRLVFGPGMGENQPPRLYNPIVRRRLHTARSNARSQYLGLLWWEKEIMHSYYSSS